MALKLFLLSLVLFLLQTVAAVNGEGSDSSDPRSTPNLGITYDAVEGPVVAKKQEPTRYSSVLRFPGQDAWTGVLGSNENRLSEVARKAFWQMYLLNKAEKNKKRQLPTVMTAFAVGDEIYLSSSLKGTQSFIFQIGAQAPLALRQVLAQCSVDHIERFPNGPPDYRGANQNFPDHNNNANCGEQMALFMYFTRHREDQNGAAARLRGVRIVTVRRDPSADKTQDLRYEEIQRFDPCATREVDTMALPKLLGCAQVLNKFGMIGVRELDATQVQFEEFQLPNADDGHMITEQVSLDCNSW